MSYTESYKNYTITIDQDTDSESPREWDTLGTMVCNHRNYNLGDKESKQIPWDQFNSWDEVEKYLRKKYDVAVLLPIFIYDHSGITINTTGFSCQWDSGQVGFIFVEKKKVRAEYRITKITAQIKDKVTKYLTQDVKTYSQYLEGEVYWFSISDKHGNEVDSCGGYYGFDEVKNECKSIVDALPQSNAEDFILNQIPDILKLETIS